MLKLQLAVVELSYRNVALKLLSTSIAKQNYSEVHTVAGVITNTP